MADLHKREQLIRFGVFEVDRKNGELRKRGVRLKLQDLPFRFLAVLLEKPGEIVPREKLIGKLWPNGTYVDHEQSLGSAVYAIRQALGDSADSPRFVETIPRRGYRFIPTELVSGSAGNGAADNGAPRITTPHDALARDKVVADTEESDEFGASPVATTTPSGFQYIVGPSEERALLVAVLGALLAVVFGFLWLSSQNTVAETPLRRFAVSPAPGVRDSSWSRTAAVAPNGEHIAFVGAGPARKLWVQDLDQQQPRAIEGTEGAGNPFWSPDSKFIGFGASSELRKVPVQGGAAIRICPITGPGYGSTWSPDGQVIVFSSGNPGVLYEVPAGGGAAKVLFSPDDMDSTPGETTAANLYHPHFLPPEAGARVLAFSFGTVSSPTLMVQDLESGRREILKAGTRPAYSPSGHLVYQAGSVAYELWALPFSLSTLQATGDPFLLSENGRGLTVAGDGTLVYVDHVPKMYQLAFVDRTGALKEQIGQPMEDVHGPTLSPDGRRVAFSAVRDFNRDIWIHDLERNLLNRLTTAPEIDWAPVWSAKGDEVAFTSDRRGMDYDIFRQRVDGTAEPEVLVGTPARETTGPWSRDGKYFIYRRVGPQTRSDIWYLLREGGDWTPHPFLQTPANEAPSQLSPDSRYVAYRSSQSGRRELYVQSFPEGENVSRISRNGGSRLRWNSNGKELFYQEGNTLIAVAVSMSPSFSPGEPIRLFDADALRVGGYDVSPDGQQFIIAQPVGDPPQPSIRVVQNWYEEFRDREQD